MSGRSDLPYKDRVWLDSHYVRIWSIWLDLQILGMTLFGGLRHRNAYYAGRAVRIAGQVDDTNTLYCQKVLRHQFLDSDFRYSIEYAACGPLFREWLPLDNLPLWETANPDKGAVLLQYRAKLIEQLTTYGLLLSHAFD